jgi:hypothetical protein
MKVGRLAPIPRPFAPTHTIEETDTLGTWDPGETLSPAQGPLSAQVYTLPAGLTVNDVDIFEINEAFASQVSLSQNCLGPGSPIGVGGPAGQGAVEAPAALASCRQSTVWRS